MLIIKAVHWWFISQPFRICKMKKRSISLGAFIKYLLQTRIIRVRGWLFSISLECPCWNNWLTQATTEWLLRAVIEKANACEEAERDKFLVEILHKARICGVDLSKVPIVKPPNRDLQEYRQQG